MANLQKIRDLMQEKNFTLAGFSSQLGITKQALLKILRENSTKIETLERISALLKVSPAIFFEDELTKSLLDGKQKSSTPDSDKDALICALQARIAEQENYISDLRSMLNLNK